MIIKIRPSGYTKSVIKRMYIFFGCICAALSMTCILAILSWPLKVVHYEVRSPKVDGPFRVVQVSDLHDSKFGKDMSQLKSEIDKAGPDLIALTGDIYDDKLPNDNTTELMRYIGTRYECIYIAGNHEFYDTGKWRTNKALAESLGVKVAEGENFVYGDITVCAAAKRLEDLYDDQDQAVERCAEQADRDSFVLLLSHYPHKIDDYRAYGCFDLILCGHAHGGQWRLPWSQNGLYAPDQGLFPKWSGGRFDFDDTTMIVSRGLCRTKHKIPRIFNRPELVMIDIIPE